MRKAVFGILIAIVAVGIVFSVARQFFSKRPIGLQDSASTASEAARFLPEKAAIQRFGDEKPIELSSFKGKALLINFWASWCEACMAEMPSINKLYNDLRGEGFDVVAINVDDNPASVVPGIIKKLNLDFPVYLDPTGALTRSFDVVAIPFSVIVARDQRVLWAESGERDWASAEMLAGLRKVLKEK